LSSEPVDPSSALCFSPTQITQFAQLGSRIYYNATYILATWSVYGMYFMLATVALYTLMKRPDKSRRTMFLLSALVLTFCIATILTGIQTATFFVRLRVVFIQTVELPAPARWTEFSVISWVRPAITTVDAIGGGGATGFIFVINDILAAWRALAVWRLRHRRVLAGVLLFLILATFVFWLYLAVAVVQMSRGASIPALSNTNTLAIASITSSCVSIVVNLLATFMLGYSAYTHRRIEQKLKTNLHGARILLLLAESGLLFAIFQIVSLALSSAVVPSTPQYGSLDTATVVFSHITVILVSMYTPALIIILNHGYSVSDTIQVQTASPGGSSRAYYDKRTLSGIEFAGNQTTDDTGYSEDAPTGVSDATGRV
ncbi:hypothetical protein BDV98DRAFT_576845, partial [Pterulicium gracile]